MTLTSPGAAIRIPLYKPQATIGEEVLEPIREVLRSGWLTLGEKTRAFEAGFANVAGVEHAVAVSNCTAALYLAYEALGIGPGKRVAVPALTFSATANAARWRGAEIALVDVDEDGNLDPDALEGVLAEERVDAVVPVHLYGLPADMGRILRVARAHGLAVVEDCAHAPGARIDGRPVGGLGDAGCFSFYATKNITTGEGGMLTTNRSDLYERARSARSHSQTKDPQEKMRTWGYDVDGLGFNLRMSEIQAAMGVSQLSKLDALNKARGVAADHYRASLTDVEGITLPREVPGRESAHHLFVVQFEGAPARNRAYAALQDAGILSAVHYPPLHLLSYYRRTTSYREGDFPRAEERFARSLSLPFFPGIAEGEVAEVARVLRGALEA